MSNNTERAQVGWRFWLGWVLVSTVALFVALVTLPLALVRLSQGVAIALALGGVVIGASVGIAQWFLLRREVSRAGWWVLASAVGVALGFAVIFAVFAVGGVVASPVGRDVGYDVASAMEEAVGGAVASAMGREVANVVAPAVEDAMGGDEGNDVRDAVEETMEEALEAAMGGDVGYDVEDAVEEAAEEAVVKVMGEDVGYDVGDAVLNALEEAAEEAVFDAVEEGVFDAAEGDVASAVEEAVASAVEEAMEEAVVKAVEEAMEEAVVEETLASVASVEGFAMFGAAIGIAQWFVLRREVSRAGWWVLASTAGFAVGGAVSLAALERMRASMGCFICLPNPVAVAGFFLGLALYGAITGGVMVWLLRQPVAKEISSRQAAE